MNGEKVCTLAIYPKYAKRIFAGDKLFEFRKRCPDWLRTGAQIILFSADTPKNILGGFTVVGVWHGTPETLWKRTSAHAGIDRNSYLRYYEGYSDAYAFRISKVWKAKVGLTVFDLCGHDESFTVPTQKQTQDVVGVKLGRQR